jgi:hypothetical protein
LIGSISPDRYCFLALARLSLQLAINALVGLVLRQLA